jgi:hypothetical protein
MSFINFQLQNYEVFASFTVFPPFISNLFQIIIFKFVQIHVYLTHFQVILNSKKKASVNNIFALYHKSQL